MNRSTLRQFSFRVTALAILLFSVSAGSTQTPSGDEILNRIDQNLRAANRISISKMTIHGRRSSRTLIAKSWIEGSRRSFTEYLAPAREKGTKMLKLDNQLWTYSPSTDRTIRISGHMLRQSVMGSDLSYEDLLEDQELRKLYTAEVTGTDSTLGRECWVVQLTANSTAIAYHTRKIWVDKQRYLPIQEHRYAKSGKLLKTTQIDEAQKVGERWFLKHAVFKDALKKGKGTEIEMESVQFEVEIPTYKFSKASLKK